MEIEKKKESGWLEFRISGRLDASRTGYLESELEEAVRCGEHRIRLNLEGVAFLSSAGIRILMKYFQSLKRLGGCLFIADPSREVRTVLDLSGLSGILLETGDELPGVAKAAPESSGTRHFCREALKAEVYEMVSGGSLICRLAGDPSKVFSAAFDPGDCVTVSLSQPKKFALGLGALAGRFEDLSDGFGEFLAAGGSAVYLPTGREPHVPDYMLSQGALIPEVRMMYAAICEGEFSHCVRFEHGSRESFVPLSAMVEALMEIEKSPAIGWVMIAETAGLIGAALKKSPVLGKSGCPVFTHPLIREWISFTSEHVYSRSLVLSAGIAASDSVAELRSFVRPLRKDAKLGAHIHAAAFDFKALPQGPLPLDETAGALYKDGKVLGFLHLVNDDREITGAGESIFTRGAVWVAPITRVEGYRP
jgi:anti-anti-sigma factor